MEFEMPKDSSSSIIKVIGVGGGGSNAVSYMYNKGIKGVDFYLCNTDAQHLEKSPVQNKIQLGSTLTEGLGAGHRDRQSGGDVHRDQHPDQEGRERDRRARALRGLARHPTKRLVCLRLDYV